MPDDDEEYPRLALWYLISLPANAWPVLGPEAAPTGAVVRAEDVFAPADLPVGSLTAPWDALARVAGEVEGYLAANATDPAAGVGMLSELGVDPERVRATLAFVAGTARTSPGQLADPEFVREHFELYRWTPDRATASSHGVKLDAGQVRLTRYLVYRLPGSPVRTDVFSQALYAPPSDDSCRLRFTRQQVMAGAYLSGGSAPDCAQPLVWLTREGVHQALMQGTVQVDLPDGARRTFNVFENNGIAFDRRIADPERQARYWYFQETDGILGWGWGNRKVAVEPGVTVAGDVFNLGLGKVLLLADGETARFVVLADTGGAFQPNLYQLDFLTGTYGSEAEFQADTASLPREVSAYILLLKSSASVSEGNRGG